MPYKPHRFIAVSTVYLLFPKAKCLTGEEVYVHKIFPVFSLTQGGCASSTQKCDSLENLPTTQAGFGARTVEWRTLRHKKYDTKTSCVAAQEGRAQPAWAGYKSQTRGREADCKVIWCPLMARMLLIKVIQWTQPQNVHCHRWQTQFNWHSPIFKH